MVATGRTGELAGGEVPQQVNETHGVEQDLPTTKTVGRPRPSPFGEVPVAG